MDTLQKSQLKQSELKVKLNEMLDTAEEQRAESFETDLKALTQQVKQAEIVVSAALLAAPEPEAAEKVEARAEVVTETAEDKAEVELRSEINFGKYIAVAMAGTGVTSGPEAELNEHLNLEPNQFPMDLLAPAVEQRAARDGNADVRAKTWVDRVFSDSAAMRLGITFESVAAGIQAFPIMTAGGNPAQRGRTQASSEETYTFAVSTLSPTRMAVHAIYSVEDNARVSGLADAILRDMRSAIVEKLTE